MDYEKKYKEAIGILEFLIGLETVQESGTIPVKDIINTFPELKSHNDERIRKSLISVFTTHKKEEMYYGTSVDEILEWLDRQGEQKPTDKAEPKFKVGDKIRHRSQNITATIVDIKKGEYILSDSCGSHMQIEWQDNYELVVRPKKCLFMQDHYTDEDRKVLCADCDEKDCELRSKPIKLREQKGVLGKMLDKLDDKEIEKVRQEMIKESGDELAMKIESLSKRYPEVSYAKLSRIAVHIAKWQRKQIIDKACEWLDGAIPDYIELKRANVDTFIDIDNKKFVDDFRKAMED